MNDAALAELLPEDLEEDSGYLIAEPETLPDHLFLAAVEDATERSKPKLKPVPTKQVARRQILMAMDEMLKKAGMRRAERRTFLYKKPRSFDLSAMSRELIHQTEENNRNVD